MASSVEGNGTIPCDNGLSDSKVVTQVQRNNKAVKAHSLDGSTPSTEASLEASFEVSEGAPILLDTTIDSAVTMAFIHTPEVFAGRAISESTTPTAASVEDPLAVLLRRAKNTTTPSYTDPSTSISTPRFARDRSVSLISRALGSPCSNDFYNQTEFSQDLDLALSADDHSPVGLYSKSKAHSDIRPRTEDSYLGSSAEENHWISKWSKFTSVFPLDAENTILEIEGERYKIPNSDLWIFPYDKEQVMAADQLAQLIRPNFYASMNLQGPQRAIEAVNGHRLEPNSRDSNPLDAIETTGSAATETAHESEGQSDNLLPSLSSSILKLADRLESLSTGLSVTEVEGDSSNEPSDTPPEYNSAPGNIEMDGTLERTPRPLLSPIHLIRNGSLQSVNTVGTPRSDGEYEVDFDELCRFVDTVRAALPTQIIRDDDLEQLTEIMHVFLDAECSEGGDEKTGLGIIARIRFDKLLADLLSLKAVNVEYMGLIAKASTLQRMWKERFRGDYLLIDTERLEIMFTHGMLRGLTLETHAETKLPLWLVERGPPIADADLKPGHFWLNLECAYRDGVVESNIEKLTLGRYDSTPTLPLLTGIEVYDRAHPGRTRYRKQCLAEEIPFKLMARSEDFKGKIRILRGHGLESKYAPKAGVRYDGEYLITNWAHLPTPDPDLDIRHFELVLERVPGQRSVQHVPSPAQMDDWYLYQRYVASQKSRALKAYSSLLTEEASSMKDEAERKTDVANTEWEFDQTLDAHSRVVENGFKHREYGL